MNSIKKIAVSISMVFALVMALIMPMTVQAANKGPNKAAENNAYIQLITWKYDDAQESYVEVHTHIWGTEEHFSHYPGAVQEDVKGFSYNASNNTLTITNYKNAGASLDVNEMGDDFKIKLVGTNELQNIQVWGYMYGGSLTVTGKGKLTVNKNKNLGIPGIYLRSELSASKFVCDKNVKLTVYTSNTNTNAGSQYAILSTQNTKSSGVITFKTSNKKTLNKKVKKAKKTYVDDWTGESWEAYEHSVKGNIKAK